MAGLAELPCQPEGQWGQDVAMVRLSPEKEHSGARVGGFFRTPVLADGCLSSPPTSSSAPLLGVLSPWWRGLRRDRECTPRSAAA